MILISGTLCSAFLSCNNSTDSSDAIVVARAYDKVFTLDSLSARIPDELSLEDSSDLAGRLVNVWLREQVLISQAEKSLVNESASLQKRIDEYRNTLLISEYEKLYVKSRLDTVITDGELEEFHSMNPELFKLSDHVVKVAFVFLPEEEQDLDSAMTWLAAADSVSIPKLQKWCIEHNAHYGLNTDYWWFLSDLLDVVPMQIYRLEDQLKTRKVVTFEHEAHTYMLHILDHRLKDLPSPLPIAKEQIQEIILQSRKKELLQELRDELVKEAWSLELIGIDTLSQNSFVTP